MGNASSAASPASPSAPSLGVLAARGGLAGASATGIQVFSLMWLHTIANHNHFTGLNFSQSAKALYVEGGIRRFYFGLTPALTLAVVCRFGDVASNTYVLSATEGNQMPMAARTAIASSMAAVWRMALTPLDTAKKVMQVRGRSGVQLLAHKWKLYGMPALYQGVLASGGYSLVSHFCWFGCYNTLSEALPSGGTLNQQTLRNGLIGLCSSTLSITVANAARVVQTLKQTSTGLTTYREAVNAVLVVDGIGGLFSRGLKARIASYGCQGFIFAALWKRVEMLLQHQHQQDRT